MEEERPAASPEPRRAKKRVLWLTSLVLLGGLAWLIFQSRDQRLRTEAQNRESYFVELHCMIVCSYMAERNEAPESLDDALAPVPSSPLVKPFHGNIAYKRTGEDTFVLEEPEERWVSLTRKDRMVGDAKGCHWEKSGATLVKR
jgi:hypothetical protein